MFESTRCSGNIDPSSTYPRAGWRARRVVRAGLWCAAKRGGKENIRYDSLEFRLGACAGVGGEGAGGEGAGAGSRVGPRAGGVSVCFFIF